MQRSSRRLLDERNWRCRMAKKNRAVARFPGYCVTLVKHSVVGGSPYNIRLEAMYCLGFGR